MTTTTVSIVIALGSIASLILWLLRKFYTKRSMRLERMKSQERVDEITKEMSKMFSRMRPYNFERYSKLTAERLLLNRRIARINKLLAS